MEAYDMHELRPFKWDLPEKTNKEEIEMNRNLGMSVLVLTMVCGWSLAFPHAAMAASGSAPWESALQTVVDFMTGSTARLIAILAVAGVGVGMLAGYMSIRSALSVIVGIAVVFGSATIVDLFSH
jgi:type IV secretion system protein VirB2